MAWKPSRVRHQNNMLRGSVEWEFLHRISGRWTRSRRTFPFADITRCDKRTVDLADTDRYQIIDSGTNSHIILDLRGDRALKIFSGELHAMREFQRELALGHMLAHGRTRCPYLPEFHGVGHIEIINAPDTDEPITTYFYSMTALFSADGWLEFANHRFGDDTIYHRLPPDTLLDIHDELIAADAALQQRGVKGRFSQTMLNANTGAVLFIDYGHLEVLQLTCLLDGKPLQLTSAQIAAMRMQVAAEEHGLERLTEIAEQKRTDPSSIGSLTIDRLRIEEESPIFQAAIAELVAANFIRVHTPADENSRHYLLAPISYERIPDFIEICARHFDGLEFFSKLLCHLDIMSGHTIVRYPLEQLLQETCTAYRQHSALDAVEQANSILSDPFHKFLGSTSPLLSSMIRYRLGSYDLDQMMAPTRAALRKAHFGRRLYFQFLSARLGQTATGQSLRDTDWQPGGVMTRNLHAWEKEFRERLTDAQRGAIITHQDFPCIDAFFVEILGRPLNREPITTS